MFTANTMSSSIEALGMALPGESGHTLSYALHTLSLCPGTASGAAVTRSNQLTDKKKEQCVAVVEQVFTLLETQLHTRDIMTRKVPPLPPSLLPSHHYVGI